MAALSAAVVGGIRRLRAKGFSLRFIADRYQCGTSSVQRYSEEPASPIATRCGGCGGRQAGPCVVCRERARALARRLLARRMPLDVIELRVASQYPHLTREQRADVLNPLLLFSIL